MNVSLELANAELQIFRWNYSLPPYSLHFLSIFFYFLHLEFAYQTINNTSNLYTCTIHFLRTQYFLQLYINCQSVVTLSSLTWIITNLPCYIVCLLSPVIAIWLVCFLSSNISHPEGNHGPFFFQTPKLPDNVTDSVWSLGSK